MGGDVHNADEIAVFRWTGVAGLPSHEPSMLCPLHGLVSRDRLAYHDAISAVVEANNERVARRRQFRSDDHISPPEAWLVAALWFYKEPPLLQHAAGRYDLDLYYAAQRLAVEVDGKNHIRRLDRDAQRDEILLEQHRIRTLRIKAHLILRDPLATAREVCRTLANINVDARENA